MLGTLGLRNSIVREKEAEEQNGLLERRAEFEKRDSEKLLESSSLLQI